MRLIDADKLKKHYAWWENGTAEMTLAEAKKNFDIIIDLQPTVDAEPVVRCKDCVHYWKNNPSDDVPVCLASPKDDAFCSEGERREDETD